MVWIVIVSIMAICGLIVFIGKVFGECEHDWEKSGNGSAAICIKCGCSGDLQHPGMW
jgi:hypothetical protein